MVSDDRQLLLAAAAGDMLAFGAFVRATQDDVYRYCAYLGRGEDPADLVQETYVRALRSVERFEGRSDGRTWALSIARRVCADAIRKAQRRRSMEQRWSRERIAESAATRDVDFELSLQALSPERREAFVLTQLVGMSYAEAAVVCRVPVGTIRSRVARAREDLQRGLEEAAG